MNLSKKDIGRFWIRVQYTSVCWEWIGARFPNGYGRIKIQGANEYAHRIAYTVNKGPIPKGMHVCHSCDNPGCCNPDHLWLGTATDNVQDRDSKGRNVRGERSPQAKLTEEAVRAIREQHHNGVPGCDLATQYNVSRPTISAIVHRKAWRHITDESEA